MSGLGYGSVSEIGVETSRLWSAAACRRFVCASLLAPMNYGTSGVKPPGEKREQAPALQKSKLSADYAVIAQNPFVAPSNAVDTLSANPNKSVSAKPLPQTPVAPVRNEKPPVFPAASSFPPACDSGFVPLFFDTLVRIPHTRAGLLLFIFSPLLFLFRREIKGWSRRLLGAARHTILSRKIAWAGAIALAAVPLLILIRVEGIESPRGEPGGEVAKWFYIAGMAAILGGAIFTGVLRARRAAVITAFCAAAAWIVHSQLNDLHYREQRWWEMREESHVAVWYGVFTFAVLLISGFLAVRSRSLAASLASSIFMMALCVILAGGALLAQIRWLGFGGYRLEMLLSLAVGVLIIFAAIYFPHHRRLGNTWFPVRLPRLKSARRAGAQRS